MNPDLLVLSFAGMMFSVLFSGFYFADEFLERRKAAIIFLTSPIWGWFSIVALTLFSGYTLTFLVSKFILKLFRALIYDK